MCKIIISIPVPVGRIQKKGGLIEKIIIQVSINFVMSLERDMAQWLERRALSMSMPALQFRIPLGSEFSEKYHVSPLSILGHCFDVVSLGKALNP